MASIFGKARRYCQFCCLFPPTGVGKSKIIGKSLVTAPYSRWKDAEEDFKRHENLEYHKNSLIFGQNFIDVQKKKHHLNKSSTRPR